MCAQAAPEEQKVAAAPTGPVEEIRIVNEDGKVLKANPPGISVKLGEPLDPDAVAKSIRTLYQTGDYADLKAVASPEQNGIRLDFVVRENLFFNQIVILGLKPPPSEASASGAMQLSLGETYRAGDLEEGISRLKDALRDDGLYQAKVTAEQRPHPETHQLDVIVNVDPGPRVRLSRVDLQNATEYSDAALLKLFRLKTGSELTIARGQSAVDRIRKFLAKNGHLSERVSLRRGEYDALNNTLPLTLDVTAGPIVHVNIVGAKFSKRRSQETDSHLPGSIRRRGPVGRRQEEFTGTAGA